jgi:hypothetical protein
MSRTQLWIGLTIVWLIACAYASGPFLPGASTGGCDGGLCLMGLFFLPFVWGGIGLVLLVIGLVVRTRLPK